MSGENRGRTETLRWRREALELLDQRLLPGEIVYRRYDSAAGVAEAIRDMVVRGAPAIGCAAAYGVAAEARRLHGRNAAEVAEGMREGFDILAASRPTAVNLFWALDRMRHVLGEAKDDIAGRLLDEAHEIFGDDVRINRLMGAHGAELLQDNARVLTHCNAGALATAGHGTALGVVRSAVAMGKRIAVIAGETRPYLQGARLTAWELMQDKIPVTLITDGMTGHMMAKGEVDAVIVGADRVAANGDVANKIGTYGIAVLADRHEIPFYVACPLSSIDMSLPTGDEIPIEERHPDEVTGYRGARWAPAGASARNPSFDVTPAALISALITERGVTHHPTAEKLKALFENEAVE